jgi:hypothetical protein
VNADRQMPNENAGTIGPSPAWLNLEVDRVIFLLAQKGNHNLRTMPAALDVSSRVSVAACSAATLWASDFVHD